MLALRSTSTSKGSTQQSTTPAFQKGFGIGPGLASAEPSPGMKLDPAARQLWGPDPEPADGPEKYQLQKGKAHALIVHTDDDGDLQLVVNGSAHPACLRVSAQARHSRLRREREVSVYPRRWEVTSPQKMAAMPN